MEFRLETDKRALMTAFNLRQPPSTMTASSQLPIPLFLFYTNAILFSFPFLFSKSNQLFRSISIVSFSLFYFQKQFFSFVFWIGNKFNKKETREKSEWRRRLKLRRNRDLQRGERKKEKKNGQSLPVAPVKGWETPSFLSLNSSPSRWVEFSSRDSLCPFLDLVSIVNLIGGENGRKQLSLPPFFFVLSLHSSIVYLSAKRGKSKKWDGGKIFLWCFLLFRF